MANNNKQQQQQMAAYKEMVLGLELEARRWKALAEVRRYALEAESLDPQYKEFLGRQAQAEQEKPAAPEALTALPAATVEQEA